MFTFSSPLISRAIEQQFSSSDAMVPSDYLSIIRLSLVTVSCTTGGVTMSLLMYRFETEN